MTRAYREPDPLLDWKPSESPPENYVEWLNSPLAREGDPVTSHEAGEHVAATTRETHCAELLWAIEKTPGKIAAYYVKMLGIEGGWKRCSDLVTAGKAHYSGMEIGPKGRKCGKLWPGGGGLK